MFDPAVAESVQYLCMALAALTNLLSVLLIITSWQSLPQSIPAHFGVTGRPDRWGGRWHLFLILAVQTLLNAGLYIAGEPQPFISYLQAIVGTLMAYVIWTTIRIAKGEATKLNPLILYGMLALLAVPAMLQAFIK